MGERAGNTRLAEVVAALHDHTRRAAPAWTSRGSSPSRGWSRPSAARTSRANTPIVGRDVFTQTAGIHADGDAKGDLYANRLAPDRFGRARRYALGKLSGKASLDHNLKALGIELPERATASWCSQRIVELGDKKHTVVPEDLPYIIADVLKTPDEQLVRVESYRVDGRQRRAARGRGRRSPAAASARRREATGDGGYDAFMNALQKAARALRARACRSSPTTACASRPAAAPARWSRP